MIRTSSLCATSTKRLGSILCSSTGIALLAWLAIFATAVADAEEPTSHDPIQQASVANGLLNRPAAASANPAASSVAVEEVGVLILRSDGGDPKELRLDDFGNLVYIARRNGEGRAYRSGREVEINPAVKESAAQIVAAQFGASGRGELAVSGLPVSAQYALLQFMPSNVKPRVLFAHITSRIDTAQVSEKMAAKLLALESSVNSRTDMVALVKAAMQMFGLKSDACDNSQDERCNEPGVREAFAQIKREEAQQRSTAASRF